MCAEGVTDESIFVAELKHWKLTTMSSMGMDKWNLFYLLLFYSIYIIVKARLLPSGYKQGLASQLLCSSCSKAYFRLQPV